MNKCGIYINLLTAKRRRLFFKNTSFGNNFSGWGHSGSKWAVIGFSRLDFLYLRCYHLSAHTDCITPVLHQFGVSRIVKANCFKEDATISSC